jgi:hypothetical protein
MNQQIDQLDSQISLIFSAIQKGQLPVPSVNNGVPHSSLPDPLLVDDNLDDSDENVEIPEVKPSMTVEELKENYLDNIALPPAKPMER